MKVETLIYLKYPDLRTYRKILMSISSRLGFSDLGFKNWVLQRIRELEKTFYFVYGTAEY